MANIIKNFLGYLKLEDEDDDYDDLDEQLEKAEHIRRKNEKKEQKEIQRELQFEARQAKSGSTVAEDKPSQQETKRERSFRVERTSSNKIVPIKTTPKGLEVCIMKPSSFEDSQDVCDMLLTGRASVVNLEGFDPVEAQRIMDFISGCVYAINGKLHQISKYIFIFSPDTIDISGDYLEFVPDDGFEVPTLNKDF